MADLASELGLDVIEGRDAGGNPLLEEGEAVLHTFGAMQLILAADSDQGPGKLFVTEGCVAADAGLCMHTATSTSRRR